MHLRCLAALRQECAPPGNVIEGDCGSVLDESGDARRGPRVHQGAYPVELLLVKCDGHLPGRHTDYHAGAGDLVPSPYATQLDVRVAPK